MEVIIYQGELHLPYITSFPKNTDGWITLYVMPEFPIVEAWLAVKKLI